MEEDGIKAAAARRSFVFQNFNLLARTSAIENVELPDFYLGRLGRAARESCACVSSRVLMDVRDSFAR